MKVRVRGRVLHAGTTPGPYVPVASDDFARYADHAALRAAYENGAKGSIWTFGTVDWNNVALVPDPLYGKALRITLAKQTPFYDLVNYRDGMPGATLRTQVTFPTPMDGVWIRGRFRFDYDAALQPAGFTTKSPSDPSPWGGSLKMFFLHWQGFGGRGELVYTNTKRLDFGYYINGLTKVTESVIGDRPSPWFMNDTGAPEFSNREWYEFVYLHRKTGGLGTQAGAWIRRITGAGAPSPWHWILSSYTWSATPPQAKSIELLGNKNHGNEFDQWVTWGPWEVYDATQAVNPFNVPLP